VDCIPASFIATKTSVFWSRASELYGVIRDENRLPSNIECVHVDISPPGGDLTLPSDQWIYHVNQYEMPSWYNGDEVEARCRIELADWMDTKVFIGGVHTIRMGACYAVGTATIEAFGRAIVFAAGETTVRATGNTTIKASQNARVRAEGWALVKAYGTSRVIAAGCSTVKASISACIYAYASSRVWAYGKSLVHAYNSAVVVNWSADTEIHLHSKQAVCIDRSRLGRASVRRQ